MILSLAREHSATCSYHVKLQILTLEVKDPASISWFLVAKCVTTFSREDALHNAAAW